ncbi:MAG: hypothetical protein GC150_03835 [Rhizobiales bacterium]|nr:hypothetical protein [Hyphomicrobiales bacterium]
MTMMTRGLLTIVATAGLSVLLAAPSFADANCKAYALASAKQAKDNEDRRCGFTGDDWSKDIAVHEAWCETVTPDEWRAKLAERTQSLAGCK